MEKVFISRSLEKIIQNRGIEALSANNTVKIIAQTPGVIFMMTLNEFNKFNDLNEVDTKDFVQYGATVCIANTNIQAGELDDIPGVRTYEGNTDEAQTMHNKFKV